MSSRQKRLLGVMACVLVASLGIAMDARAEVQYQLGPATELLDTAFYAGEAVDGSDVAGRMAFYGQANNAATTIAFWAVNIAAGSRAVFLVDLGDPSSWRRLTSDLSGPPDTAVYWTPDDQYILADGYRIPVATGALESYSLRGYNVSDEANTTRLASDNWLVTFTSGGGGTNLVVLPILSNGDDDTSREPVIVTQFDTGVVGVEWPHIARDGSMIAFMDWHASAGSPAPDTSDTYVLQNLNDIMNAPSSGGISSLAPTSLADANIVPIRADDTPNVAVLPYFSEDLSLVFCAEDFNNLFSDADFFGTLAVSEFDVVISNADGTGNDVQLSETGNQGAVIPTPGGVRLTYLRDVSGIIHLFVSTLVISTNITGTDLGNNDLLTTTDQEASDASGTVVDIPTDTTIDFPLGVTPEIQISTPIDPATEPELPEGVDAIPVIREFGPTGTTFDPPISVTITYTDAEIAGMDEAALSVYQYNEVSGVFDIPVTTITNRDLDNNTITFTVSHFSIYGLGGPVKQLPVGGIGAGLVLVMALGAVGIRQIRRKQR